MLKVLINAYACSPHTGSEPGMAWNWCVHLANYCELHIITEGEFKDYIEEALLSLPQGKNMHFYYNPVSDKVRKMCWNQGDWRFYRHYKKWQYTTYEIALEILQHSSIDILHQLNMIGFREPGYLWKIPNIPFVWGPVDAKATFPIAYAKKIDLKKKIYINLKNIITIFQLRYSSRVKKAVKRSDFVISASSNSQQSFAKYFDITSPLLNETGCCIKKIMINSDKPTRSGSDLNLLWVGKFDFRKQLNLAIEAVAFSKNRNIRLHIVGDAPGKYFDLAETLGISNQCEWYGKVPHQEVQNLMKASGLLFFTSVAEGTPHVVLEAISNNLPVLCFDTCGQGDSVNDEVGRKIRLSTPKQSIQDFARLINELEKNRAVLKQMSINCVQRQKELSWSVKVKEMIRLYEECL